MKKLSPRVLPTCVWLLAGATGIVASSCKTNTISSYGGSTSEAGPVDTTPATTASPSATGTGSAPPSRCTPGTKRCPGGAAGPVLETCAQDGAWVAENCPSAFPLCKLDKCVEECTPNATRCDGDSTQKCQSDRTWGASTPCPASDPICSGAGTCGKTCGAAGDTRCAGNTLETCDGVRTWGSPVACSGATPKCLKDSPAKCGIVDCTPPDESGCLGTTRRTCNPDSTWGAGTPCSGATPACLETPGTPKSAACVECSSGGGCLDARTPKTCVGGAWTPSTPCSAGSECKPATGTCGVCTGVAGANAWVQVGTIGGPPPGRSDSRLAFDPSDGSMILFGGRTGGSTVANDTWRLTGAVWTGLNPATKPSPRSNHAMATNTTNGKVYMFGGATLAGTTNNELWEWNGATWTQRCVDAACSANRPSPRTAAGLAYDSYRDRLVLVGGLGAGNTADDTWEWDGAGWTQKCGGALASCGFAPMHEIFGGAVYDSLRKRTAFLITDATSGGAPSRLYEYDGVGWTLGSGNATPPFPGGSYGAAMANVYDPLRRVLVSLGHPSEFDFRIWEWNGACWSNTSPGSDSHGARGQATAWDPTNSRIVRMGGIENGVTYHNVVWARSSL